MPSAMATRPPAPTIAPPMMNGPRTPRRSLQSPVASGTAKPAAALTSITAPIRPGRSAIRSSSTGTYVVVTARAAPSATATVTNAHRATLAVRRVDAATGRARTLMTAPR